MGSDDEEHDDMVKRINRDDLEEDEEGLDDDLDGFVVHGADNEEIEDENETMHQKFMQDIYEDDKKLMEQVISGALFGNNKKRKRGEVDGLSDDEENSKRKMRRLNEMGLNINEEGELVENYEFGKHQRMLLQNELEEELSDEEEKVRLLDRQETYKIQKTVQNLKR